MQKITVKVEDDVYKKVEARSVKNGCKTISQCARELIELGIKIEEAALLQEGENAHNAIDPMLLEILKNSLIWSMETRLLVRLLVDKNVDSNAGQTMDLMKTAKDKAI